RKFSPRRLLNKLTGALIHWIDLNAVEVRKNAIYKQRNFFGRKITPMANWFFRACRTPVRFWSTVRSWQTWEVQSFRMLHPKYKAQAVGDDAICIAKLPGVPLWDHLQRGTLTTEMLEAAG